MVSPAASLWRSPRPAPRHDSGGNGGAQRHAGRAPGRRWEAGTCCPGTRGSLTPTHGDRAISPSRTALVNTAPTCCITRPIVERREIGKPGHEGLDVARPDRRDRPLTLAPSGVSQQRGSPRHLVDADQYETFLLPYSDGLCASTRSVLAAWNRRVARTARVADGTLALCVRISTKGQVVLMLSPLTVLRDLVAELESMGDGSIFCADLGDDVPCGCAMSTSAGELQD